MHQHTIHYHHQWIGWSHQGCENVILYTCFPCAMHPLFYLDSLHHRRWHEWGGSCDESSQTKGGGGNGVPFFYCAIHQRTNQCEVFGVLFADKAQTNFNMFIHTEGDVMSYHKERGTLGGGGSGESFFDCAIHKRTNQCEVFGVLLIVDKAQASFIMVMREVGSCDESYQGVGDLIIVVNHHRQKGMGVMWLLTCQMPAWTNIDNVKTSIIQQYQCLFKWFRLFSLQSSLTEYQT